MGILKNIRKKKKIYINYIKYKKLTKLNPPKNTKKLHNTFTVVCSVYNVAPYVDDLVHSILNQTVPLEQNFELIFVDDGSVDNTAEICKKWVKKYPNFISYHYQENQGLSGARNTGITLAKNEWLTFIDPDDFIAPTYFAVMDEELQKHSNKQIDIICNFPILFHEKNYSLSQYYLSKMFPAQNSIICMDNDCEFTTASVAFNCVRKSIIDKHLLKFDTNLRHCFEDGFFMSQYVYFTSKNALVLPNNLYYYRRRHVKTSIVDSSSSNIVRYTTLVEYNLLIVDFYKKNNHNIIPRWVQIMFLRDFLWVIEAVLAKNHQTLNIFNDTKIKDNYIAKIKQFLSYVDNKYIMWTPPEKFISAYAEIGIINFFKDTQISSQFIQVEDYLPSENSIIFKHASAFKDEEISLVLHGKEVVLKPYKVQTVKFLEYDFYYIYYYKIDCNSTNLSDSVSFKSNKREDFLEIVAKKWKGLSTKTSVKNLIKKNIAISKKINLLYFLYKLGLGKYKYKNAWLFIDRDVQADDNAEHLYRYIKENHKDKNIFFILRKNSHDWQRLQKDNFNLIEFGSLQHKLALLRANFVISSHLECYIFNYSPIKRLIHFCKYKNVFLQHGIIKGDLSIWINSCRVDYFITSAAREYHSIADNYSTYKINPSKVLLSGLPRHDKLLALSKVNNKQQNKKRTIVIMPTWRSYLTGAVVKHSHNRLFNPEFYNSNYYKSWSSILESKEIEALSKNNEIIFFPHKGAEDYFYNDKFPLVKVVKPNQVESIQKLLVQADIIITDYSSIAMEGAYINKNIIYYQFDEQEFFTKTRAFTKGYFDYRKDGFGDVVETEKQLFQSINKIIDNNYQVEDIYLKKQNEFFTLKDGKASERIFNVLDKEKNFMSASERKRQLKNSRA